MYKHIVYFCTSVSEADLQFRKSLEYASEYHWANSHGCLWRHTCGMERQLNSTRLVQEPKLGPKFVHWLIFNGFGSCDNIFLCVSFFQWLHQCKYSIYPASTPAPSPTSQGSQYLAIRPSVCMSQGWTNKEQPSSSAACVETVNTRCDIVMCSSTSLACTAAGEVSQRRKDGARQRLGPSCLYASRSARQGNRAPSHSASSPKPPSQEPAWAAFPSPQTFWGGFAQSGPNYYLTEHRGPTCHGVWPEMTSFRRRVLLI